MEYFKLSKKQLVIFFFVTIYNSLCHTWNTTVTVCQNMTDYVFISLLQAVDRSNAIEQVVIYWISPNLAFLLQWTLKGFLISPWQSSQKPFVLSHIFVWDIRQPLCFKANYIIYMTSTDTPRRTYFKLYNPINMVTIERKEWISHWFINCGRSIFLLHNHSTHSMRKFLPMKGVPKIPISHLLLLMSQ